MPKKELGKRHPRAEPPKLSAGQRLNKRRERRLPLPGRGPYAEKGPANRRA